MADVPVDTFGTPTPLGSQVTSDELLYFLLNVGDGDAHVLLLPENAEERRQVVIADVASSSKVLHLLRGLVDADILAPDHAIDLLIVTHPDRDHIRGVKAVLRAYEGRVHEV